ncbi:nuclear pore complex protein Nup88 [Tetranychus urticae]|uniref:Nucleoporin Nup88 n=1 Tax=Tetranychus urticae TaxID=32264 RepID=T1L081_TETUR|nr:nuclear pore complex protein Nup88 [Tetranychus urticae]
MVRLGLGSDLYNGEMWENLLLTDPRLEKLSGNLKSFFDGKRGAANLITFDDNLLCIWDNQEQQIYCLVMKDFKLVNVQNLMPTNAPLFDVDALVMSPDGRHLALQGPRGINIMELPRKFGSQNSYESGKSSILCRTIGLAERFFVCNQQIAILETRWHPGSPSGSSHIAILTNDDCIRIYDISSPHICFQEIKLSDPSNSEVKYSSYKFASSLGQIAVSFDFGLPIDKRLTKQDNSNETFASSASAATSQANTATNTTLIEEDSCIWPIYVLKGNGDVLLVYNDLHNTYLSKRILGPLTMRPPAEDNYGVDASSIICLDCAPTLLAIATSSGMIYHCLALDNPEVIDDNGETGQGLEIRSSTFIGQNDDLLLNLADETVSSLVSKSRYPNASNINPGLSRLFTNPPTLFVVESLELVLTLTSVNDQDDSSPLRLIRPAANPQIYFCSHEAGVHIINIPFLNRLKSCEFSSLDDIEQSIIEHLICTKPIAAPSSFVPMCIPLGVALVARRGFYSVAVLLSTGEILTQRLSSVHYKYVGFTDEPESKSNLDDSISFNVHINQILKRSMNAPHIKSESNKEPSKSDCLQMLLNTTDILRKEYIARMEKATEVLVKRASTLIANKKLQLEEIEKLSSEKDSIISDINATSIKFDETLERQEKLSQRVERILESMQSHQNHLSEAERTCQKELDEISQSIDRYCNRLDQVRLKFKYQNELKESEATKGKGEDERKMKSSIISHQVVGVKKILTSQSEAIQQLVSQVNGLKQHFSQIKLLT